MKITNVFLCTQEEFDNTKTRDLIPLICTVCNEKYSRMKRYIVNHVRDRNVYPKYCSKICEKVVVFKQIKILCHNCNKEVYKTTRDANNSLNSFCSRTCSTTYNNKNKTHGTRRSKLEVYLEEQLTIEFPELEILYSNKTIIGSELDIYIPSLKLAFEVQGIFHYKPIFGQEKLDQIQKNDLEKVRKCKELLIELIQMDVTDQKTFSKKSSKRYLLEIVSKIKLVDTVGLEPTTFTDEGTL